ncbi:VOC family protein [Candidatus Rhodobacter oscarellae]|uniref:VOC family protein n=1 Tax=Candidatus Rhodobacter oscarellae TaxID=1675527 RepID=UPI00067105C0|nr:VOC family protein [Candidatus Rhodobacter lobularis]
MQITGFDHIVLSCHDVPAMVAFYRDALAMRVGEERPGKWSIWFGPHKISLQDEATKPALAVATLPGTGNFCVLTETPVAEVADRLRAQGVEILDGPGQREGATGPIMSVYFRDPEGNLIEVSNPI